jgi:A/G-specific adenine glycosylase
MEFGALQCVPKSRLQYLYFNESCAAAKKQSRSVACKVQKLKVRNRYFNYLVLEDETGYNCPEKKRIKEFGLYEFPLIETEKEEDFDAVTVHLQTNFSDHYQVKSLLEYNEKSILHKLSHQHLHIKFWKLAVKGIVAGGIDLKTLRTFPFQL